MLLGFELPEEQTTGGKERPQALRKHHNDFRFNSGVNSDRLADDYLITWKKISALSSWLKDYNLVLNVTKTKEMVVDFRR